MSAQGQREVLWQLFRNGPTWDGNIVSKPDRDELIKLGLVARENGWAYLTRDGIEDALAAGFDARKDREARDQALLQRAFYNAADAVKLRFCDDHEEYSDRERHHALNDLYNAMRKVREGKN